MQFYFENFSYPLYFLHASTVFKFIRALLYIISASLSPEKQKKQISMVHKNKIVSEETRKKLSEAGKGRIPWNTGTKGIMKAWNKGLHIPRNTYYFIKDGKEIIVKDLMTYCEENLLVYGTMIALYSGKGFYGKKGKYKGYEKFSK